MLESTIIFGVYSEQGTLSFYFSLSVFFPCVLALQFVEGFSSSLCSFTFLYHAASPVEWISMWNG